MSSVVSFTAPYGSIVCQSLVSNDIILSCIVFGVLIVLSLILVQSFVLSKQLASVLSHGSLSASFPTTTRAKLSLRNRKGNRKRLHFRYVIHSNKLPNGQSFFRTRIKPPTSLGTFEQAVQCDVKTPTLSYNQSDRIKRSMGLQSESTAPLGIRHQAVQCDQDNGISPADSDVQTVQNSAHLIEHSLSINPSFSAAHSSLSNHYPSNNTLTSSSGDNPSAPTSISVSQLGTLGINENSRIGDHLAIRDDGSEVYSIMDAMESNRMLAALIIRSNGAIEIMTREGDVFALTGASAKTFFLTSTIFSSTPRSFSATESISSDRSINTITISDLESLGILEGNIGNHYSIRDDGTKDYSIMKSNEVIAIFSVRPNRAIEIIKDGKVFALIDASGKSITISPPALSPRHRSSSYSKSPSLQSREQPPPSHARRCFWCDQLGHESSTCPQLSEDLHLGKIYITHDNRIIDTLGHSFPLAIGRGGMRSYL